jgi:hypothetical protein
MSYAAGEVLWLTRLRAMSQFNEYNSARGKFGIRDTGASDHYAILKPGPWTRSKLSPTVRLDTYRTVIQIYQHYLDDGTSMTDLETLVDAVLAELDTYRVMGDTTGAVIQANIVEAREMIWILAAPGEGPEWLLVELIGEWHEETTITYAE